MKMAALLSCDEGEAQGSVLLKIRHLYLKERKSLGRCDSEEYAGKLSIRSRFSFAHFFVRRDSELGVQFVQIRSCSLWLAQS